MFTQQVFILDNHSSLPENVQAEIKQLWQDRELGHDAFYYHFDCNDVEDNVEYPGLVKLLRQEGIETCLIRNWW